MWPTASQRADRGPFTPHFNASQFMGVSRFEMIMQYYEVVDLTAFTEAQRDADPWWRVRGLVDAFNTNRAQKVHASYIIIFDESIFIWHGEGECPHITYIPRKPEPEGVEMKNASDGLSGVMLVLEIQEGKLRMRLKPYVTELGSQAACTKRLAEPFMGTNRIMVGDAWFGSVSVAISLKKDFGLHFIGNVKQCHKFFPKKELICELATARRGEHKVCTSTIKGVPMFATGWKKNSKTVMHVISTCSTTLPGSNAQVTTCDKFGNAHRLEFSRPKVFELYSKVCGKIDQHNELRQFELALEKAWVTQKYHIRFLSCMTGIVVVDTFYALKYLVPMKYHDLSFTEFVTDLVNEVSESEKHQFQIL